MIVSYIYYYLQVICIWKEYLKDYKRVSVNDYYPVVI